MTCAARSRSGSSSASPCWKDTLDRQAEQIEGARAYTRHHLDALGARMGSLHAEVIRQNALGRRLTSIAGLEDGEFDFSRDPGLGGPAPLQATGPETQPDLMGAMDLLGALDDLSAQLEYNQSQMAVLESLIIDRKLGDAQLPDVWPTSEGWISSGYGYRIDPFDGKRSFHSGLDIAAPAGTPIKAVASGVVTDVYNDRAYGLTLEINHGNGYVTRYAHTGEVGVEEGDKVTKGQTVATIGSSGRATGPHLHFEVYKDSRSVNPRKYLQAAAKQ